MTTLVRHRRGMHAELNPHPKPVLDAADPVYRRWITARLRGHDAVAWIAEDGVGAVAGSGCLWLRENQPGPGHPETQRPYLMSVYTDPAFRGRGIATQITNVAIEWARDRGFGRLTLHASKMGRPVYERLGFVLGSEMRIDLEPVPPRRRTAARKSRRPARRKPARRKD